MLKKAVSKGAPPLRPKGYSTLAEMLIQAAGTYPEKGLVFVNSKGDEEILLYPDLLIQAKQKLTALNLRGIHSRDKLIIVIDNSKEFYIAYWACLLGGIIPAPVSQPSTWKVDGDGIQKLIKIHDTLDHPYILIEEKNQSDCEALKEFRYLVTESLMSTEEGVPEGLNTEPDDLVFLQFSSGSTGTPKGVMLTNRNILTNVYALSEALAVEESDVSFTWVPHTHDMGLFVQHLTPLSRGSTVMIFSPYTFVRSPYLFLKKFAEHKGTWFCSTNFGFDWMTKAIREDQLADLDFSHMRFALNGAEPISVEVTDSFCEKFAVCGFKEEMMLPSYGMAEATVGVSIPELKKKPLVQNISRAALINKRIAVKAKQGEQTASFYLEGKAIRGVTVRIVNEEGTELNEEEVGEIQLRGESVSAGYYNNPQINQELFTDGWLKTGDLGYISGGRVAVTGRMKDMIIVRGQNYYAHDLEEVVYRSGLGRRGNVIFAGTFNFQNQKEEILVFIKERTQRDKLKKICDEIHRTVREEVGLHIDYIIPIRAVPKTTSGKVQRYALKSQYEQGEFADVFPYPEVAKADTKSPGKRLNEVDLAEFMHNSWAEILAISKDSFTIDDSFKGLGGNSIKMYLFLAKLNDYLGIEAGAEIFQRNQTIREICAYLKEDHLKTAPLTEKETGKENPAAAVTGMALRLPGAVDADTFWKNICEGVDSIAKVSEKRKQLAEDPEWNDIMGEWKDIDYFDYEFFDIPEKEAVFMDPQHRNILEMAQEALDDAGVLAEGDQEKNIGVYVGANSNVYFHKVINYVMKNKTDEFPANTLVRNLQNVIAAGITHHYNFTGPALAIDTACSSFLVSLHYAAQAIRRKEISGAVVASANIMEDASIHTLARNAGILTAGTKSKVFDAAADGSLLGEGAVVVYLEGMTEETIKNKNIYGIIKGSAINNDGVSYGIMAPNPKGQYEVLKAAYQDAGVSPQDISYFEAHGTGTTIGDPIEVNALKKLFAGTVTSRNRKMDIKIGSVKPNIGHLLPAAGGAALAKVLLSIKNKKIPPSLHVDRVNPSLELEKSPFRIADTLEEWDTEAETRMAGITSLGLGGTNCHVVVSEWQNEPVIGQHRRYELVTLSAKSEAALKRMDVQMNAWLNKCDAKVYGNAAYTRNRYREHYQYRTALLLDREKGSIVPAKTEYHQAGFRHLYLHIENIGEALPEALSRQRDHANCSKLRSEVAEILKEHNLIHQADKLESFVLSTVFVKNLTKEGLIFKQITGEADGAVIASYLNGTMELKEAVLQYLNKDPAKCDNTCEKKGIILTMKPEKKVLSFADEKEPETEISWEEPERSIAEVIKKVYLSGGRIDWNRRHPDGSGRIIHLPAYPFEKKSVWLYEKEKRQ